MTYFYDNEKRFVNTSECSLNDFPLNISLKRINKLKCINFDKENLEISGEDPVGKFLLIELSVNSDPNPKFYSKFNPKFVFNNPFYFYWFENIVNVKNYSDPVESIINVEKIYLQPNITQIINASVSKMEFSSDNNIFYNHKITKNLSFVDKISTYSYRTDNGTGLLDNALIRIYLKFSRKMTSIDRTYKNLDQFLAEFGSINTNLLLILTFFVKFLNEFWSHQKLMNKILKFREYLKVNDPNHLNLIKLNFKKRT